MLALFGNRVLLIITTNNCHARTCSLQLHRHIVILFLYEKLLPK